MFLGKRSLCRLAKKAVFSSFTIRISTLLSKANDIRKNGYRPNNFKYCWRLPNLRKIYVYGKTKNSLID